MSDHVTPVVVSWSGGKDCCLSLFEVQKASAYRVEGLFTTCTRDFDRISMHGVREFDVLQTKSVCRDLLTGPLRFQIVFQARLSLFKKETALSHAH